MTVILDDDIKYDYDEELQDMLHQIEEDWRKDLAEEISRCQNKR
jgi:hypothetical protein